MCTYILFIVFAVIMQVEAFLRRYYEDWEERLESHPERYRRKEDREDRDRESAASFRF
jgi:hypothetical protein